MIGPALNAAIRLITSNATGFFGTSVHPGLRAARGRFRLHRSNGRIHAITAVWIADCRWHRRYNRRTGSGYRTQAGTG